MAGAREIKSEKKNDRAGIAIGAGIAAGVVLAGYLGLCVWVGASGAIMPNVKLGQLDVGGMTVEQAQFLVEQTVKKHGHKASVTLNYGDWSGTVTADQLQTFGEDSALNAWRVGRGNFFAQGGQYVYHLLCANAPENNVDMELGYDGVNQQVVEDLLNEAEAVIGCETSQYQYAVEGDKLVMTKGTTGLSIDREAVKEAVYQELEQNALIEAFRGRVHNSELELTLSHNTPVEPDFEALRQELCIPPKNAEMDPKTFEVIPHVEGVEFEAAALQAAYQAAAEGETFSIPVKRILPEETTESLNQKLFANLLGEAVTRVSGSSNRKHNVKLSAQACNNIILMPGEVFSYNNTTGSRSASKGYLAAPVYSGGASVDEVGGGICQTSSTIYYAVLHTTLEVVERHAHMYATGYVPDGMDATVYYGSLDFRFKNNTKYPVKMVTESYDSNGSRYLRVRLYGTNVDGRYAVPERTQFDWIQPTKKYVADETIPQGTTKVDSKQNPYTGRSSQCYRYIYEKNGTLVEKQNMGVSKYKMRPETVYYNPLDGDPTTWVNGVPPKPVTEQPIVTPDPKPEVPVEPSKPQEQPTQPEEIAKPQEQPTQPEEPAKPQEQPTQPEEPAKPQEQPTQPEQPAQPEQDTQPEQPTQPEDPNAHLKPGELPDGL